jgi:hypothetical protein
MANLQLLGTLLSWFKDSAFTIYGLTTPMYPTVERLLVECSRISAAGDGQRSKDREAFAENDNW